MLTLPQLAQQLTNTGIPTEIINLLKMSSILNHIPVIKANKTNAHIYKHWTSLPSVAARLHNEGFIKSQPVKSVQQIDLQQLGVVNEEDEKTVRQSSYANAPLSFFDELAPTYFNSMSQAIALALFTGSATNATFENFDDYASRDSKEIDATGATSGSRTSIYAVTWLPETVGLVVDPSVIDSIMNLVRITPYNMSNGVMQPTLVQNTDSTVTPVFQVGYDATFNLLNNTNFAIAHYKNLEDTADKMPTVANLERLLDMVKATPGSTYLYTSRLGRRLINRLKDAKLQTVTTTTDYATSLSAFDGIPIFVEEAIVETK